MSFSNEHKDKISQSHLLRKADKMNQICEMAKQGKTSKEIADHFKQTPQSINKALQRRGVKALRGVNPKKGISTNPQKIQNICDMAKQGKTAQEIADYYANKGFKHSAGHIYKVLDKEGIILQRFPNGRPNANSQKVKEICDMFIGGKTVTEITKHFGFKGTGHISKVLVSHNLRSRKPNRTDGVICDTQGYLWAKISQNDPMACMLTKHGLSKGNIVLEHRLVMARKLGRPLTKEETVHHIDGNKLNNHPDNLQLFVGKHGKGQVMKCADCGSNNILSLEWLQCGNCSSTKISFTKI